MSPEVGQNIICPTSVREGLKKVFLDYDYFMENKDGFEIYTSLTLRVAKRVIIPPLFRGS